jgi:hypothetical protein
MTSRTIFFIIAGLTIIFIQAFILGGVFISKGIDEGIYTMNGLSTVIDNLYINSNAISQSFTILNTTSSTCGNNATSLSSFSTSIQSAQDSISNFAKNIHSFQSISDTISSQINQYSFSYEKYLLWFIYFLYAFSSITVILYALGAYFHKKYLIWIYYIIRNINIFISYIICIIYGCYYDII